MGNCQKQKIVEPQLHTPNFLQDISNSKNQKSSRSIQRFLSWPDYDQLNQSGKRNQSRDKMPSIASGAEWQRIISGVQISLRRLTKVGVTSKFWLKLTDVKRHCRQS